MLQTTIEAEAVPAAAGETPERPLRGLRRAADPRIQLRADTLARSAPWLAGLSAVCAIAVLNALAGKVPSVWLGAWAALIVAVDWVMVRARIRAALLEGSPRMRSMTWVVVETIVHAGLWAMLPSLVLAEQGGAAQVVIAGAFVAMTAGGILLAVVPLAAASWVAVLGAAALFGITMDEPRLSILLAVLLAVYVAVILLGCLALERLLGGQIENVARERARSESVTLLLKEYEEQGFGWLWQSDLLNRITYMSARGASLLGRSNGQLLGQSLPLLFGTGSGLGAAMAAREPFAEIEIEVDTPRGARVLSLGGSPVLGPSGEFEGYRGVGADVTEVRLSERRLIDAARRDVLTGLPNRMHMRELFEVGVAAAAAGGHPCAILFLDLDGFKPVNDSFGHSAGDQVLRAVAERLRREIGDAGRVGRIGGDEFAVLLHDGSDAREIEAIGRSIIAAVAPPYPLGQTDVRIGVSIGCAVAPADGREVEELVRKADLALYHAKGLGRGTFCHFRVAMQADADNRIRLEADLREALARDQFRLAYQPIVTSDTHQVLGFEALIRWHHPERGMIMPAEFIGLAEESGLIGDIGAWVIHQACRDAMTWPENLAVAVNLSPRQLVIPALPNAVAAALERSRLAPNRLELEVTESVFVSDADGSLDVLRRVRALGVGVALDDFGTGYSSLGYLNKTIFHTLKIDGSFVRDAAKRPETVTIIQAIVALARAFRMRIVAEGVETRDDALRMHELGCHRLQGFLFGMPMTHEETRALVGTRWEPRRLAV